MPISMPLAMIKLIHLIENTIFVVLYLNREENRIMPRIIPKYATMAMKRTTIGWPVQPDDIAIT